MYIGGTNNRYWTIHCWTTIIGSGVVEPFIIGPGDQTGRPYIFIWVDVWCTTYIIWRGGTNIIGPTIVGPSVIGPGDQTGRPYIRGVDIPELRFDKMSNEGVYNVFPRTKIRFGGFGGPSRAIRKIQIDTDRGVGTIFRRVLGRDGRPFSASRP